MADMQRPSLVERDIDQAITALKKGAHLLKYGRRGKPKFCPFRLSADESTLIWYYGKDEKKQLELRHVSRIIPGQRTSIFHRYPRPEKEYQSFSLIYNDRSLDLICKDKDEAEVWFVALKALIARGSNRKQRNESRSENALPESPRGRRSTPSRSSFHQDQGSTKPRQENTSQGKLGKAFSDVLSYTAKTKNPQFLEPISYPPPALQSNASTESFIPRTSSADNTIRISLSSAVSSSSQGSGIDDFDNLGDIFIWGEGIGEGLIGGGIIRATQPSITKFNTSTPKPLESTVVLDVHRVACGRRHAAIVTKQGELFSWGEEESGRLGHGVDSDISHPKLIQTLSEKNICMVACGEHHTCAVTVSGDLYSCGLVGSGATSKWVPKRVGGSIDGLQVAFVACGPWHTAVVTSLGKLFTFGDGTFGALGHGDRSGSDVPREVEGLKGLKTVRVACGVWHTAAIVDVATDSEHDQVSGGKLFTWGDADKGKLGHGDTMPRLAPECIASLVDLSFSQVACGNNLTVALTISGRVYTIGQQGNSSDKNIVCLRGNIVDSVDEISCGSHHIAVLTSKSEVYTWGKGSNGQLGHGDMEDKSTPTLVESLKDKQVKSISCGSNFTTAVCLRKWTSTADNSVCSGCRNPFNFMRKRHNCYNCGLVFCKGCSSKKSLRASMAPSESKMYRVCDECFIKLQKVVDGGRVSNVKMGASKSSETGNISRMSSVDSFKLERNSGKFDFPARDASSKRQSISAKSPTSPFGASQNFLSFFVPDSRRHSRSPSPIPVKTPRRSATPSPSVTPPFRLSDANLDDLKVGGEGSNTEVKSLRKQVETLTSKSQLLEDDLERKRKQLKDILAQASDEAEKSKAAEEVIKTLTLQLKEMAESEQVDVPNEQMANDPDRPSNVSSVASPKSESGDNPNPAQLHNGTKPQAKKSKRIVQDEPGVYITLVTLPNGVNELRRVRFSRKRFTEEQAEKWWAENRTKACARHNVRVTQ